MQFPATLADETIVTRRFVLILLLAASFSFGQKPAKKEPVPFPGHADVARARAMPPSLAVHVRPAQSVELPALTAAERAQLRQPRLPHQVGVHRALPARALEQGNWSTLADGRRIWQLSISSKSAVGLRIQFGNFSVGEGRVWVHNGSDVDGPYSQGGLYGNGEFWSGLVHGEQAIVEYEPATGAKPSLSLPFQIRLVGQLVTEISPPAVDPAASCNLDVNCYPAWKSSRDSVAELIFEMTDGDAPGTYACSGSLVGTRDNSFKPYLYTAGHCIHSEDSARSLQTFWAYQTSTCGGPMPATFGNLNSNNGGHLLSFGTLQQGDYSLVLLPNIPNGVVFAGWDPTDPPLGTPVVGIHHPLASYKRISFGQTIPSSDVTIGSDSLDASLYTTAGWTLGITQEGSSGSPLFTGPGVVVGALTYGPNVDGTVACAGGDEGGYGKFSLAYAALSGYFEDLPFSIVSPSVASIQFQGVNGTISNSSSQTVQLTTQTASPVEFKLRADAPWIQVSAASGTVSATAPYALTITVDPHSMTQSDTYAGTVTILSGAAPPQYLNVSVNMSIQGSNVVVSASPNPVVPQQGPNGLEWSMNLQLKEINGVATTVTGLKIDTTDYSADIPEWFGTASLGAHGKLNATITTSGLTATTSFYFEISGVDASGETWNRVFPVSFTGPNP